MKTWIKCLPLWLLLLALKFPAQAAELDHFTSAEGHEIVTLNGVIEDGDAKRLMTLVGEVNDRDVLVSGIRLNSPGGSLLEGVKLAAAVHGYKLATVIMRGTSCASACFIVFAAGTEKYASFGARIGVHGASLERQSGSIDAPAGTIAMAKLVKDLGVPPGIIGQMVVTPYSDIVWLSPTDLQSMGVTMTGDPAATGRTFYPQAPAPTIAPPQARADPVLLRRAVAPLIRALTDCVAQNATRNTSAISAYGESQSSFSAYLARSIGDCPDLRNRLLSTYDSMDGQGRGAEFLNGPYTDDLQRAVLKRVRPQLDDKLAALNRDRASQAAREAQARAEAETERQARANEAEARAAQAKLAAARAEADARVTSFQAETFRAGQLDQMKRAQALLAGKAIDCARRELGGLVKSGESAETLVTAVLILCESDVNAMINGGVQVIKLENASASPIDEGAYREALKSGARERFIALAVQTKAGSGAGDQPQSASISPSSSPAPLPPAQLTKQADPLSKLLATLPEPPVSLNPAPRPVSYPHTVTPSEVSRLLSTE